MPIVAIDDKRQLTAVFACLLAGDFLPPQIHYVGKTPACLPKAPFPSDWHITYTHNHWANEATMMNYVRSIFFPYLTAARKELKLPSDFPALAIFARFKRQMMESFLYFMETNNVIVVEVPPNCTDRLQRLDLSIKKPFKDFLKRKFQSCYADNIAQQLKDSKAIKPVDL